MLPCSDVPDYAAPQTIFSRDGFKKLTFLLSSCVPTACAHLSSAAAAAVQRHVALVSGSRPGGRLLPPRSRLQVGAGALSPPDSGRQPGRAGEDPGEAQAGGGGAAQGERHEVSLRVRGPLGRQHPGLVQHREYQNTTCHRGTVTISFFFFF